MRSRVTHGYAVGLEVLGILMIVVGIVVGTLLFFVGLSQIPAAQALTPGQVLLARGLLVAIPVTLGVVIGTLFIVSGQLILIFLDQRSVAVKHLRIARRIRRALHPRPPDDARPRQRRVI